MRRISLLALAVTLSACASNDDRPLPDMSFGFGNSAVHTPALDGYTMQRVRGQPDDVPPLAVEAGNIWPSNLTARPVNAIERSDQPVTVPPASLALPTAASPTATAPAAPPAVGQPVVVPGSPAGVTTGGTRGYQTYQVPGGGSGVVVPGTAGTSTVITPGGAVTTIPR